MAKKILVIDTSILCVWLAVPGKTECGQQGDIWDKNRVDALIQHEEQQGTTFVLPLASLIETGNHIAQANCHNRFALASELADILRKAADAQSPWAAFSNLLCEKEQLKILADEFPKLAAQKVSIGDATIKQVAEYYVRIGYGVEILTGDAGLKSYEPTIAIPKPRRRS